MSELTRYVVGFAFDIARKRVILIRKKRPAWQTGLYNGVGGHIEVGEEPIKSMVREFEEETGLVTALNDWSLYAELSGEHFNLKVFKAFLTNIDDVKTCTDEEISIVTVSSIIVGGYVIPNLHWLIPAALDRDPIFLTARYT